MDQVRLNDLWKRFGVMNLKSFLMSILIIMSVLARAQDAVTVAGQIKDENGVGIPGVTVVEKGTDTGTITDINGNYTINVTDANSILVFSFVGYASQEVLVGDRSNISLSLEQDIKSLEEIIVVGYGEQKKETVTGAVVALKGKALTKTPSMDISSSLAGRLPGVVVIQNNGEPGSDAAAVTIRGTNTLGNSNPLVVIDGIPDRDGGLSRLSPNDIESISVLKDASAAIYGARAANGAIIVTTRRGKNQKPRISYDVSYGLQTPTQLPKMSNAVEYANMMNELQVYNGLRSNPEEWTAAWHAIQSQGVYTSPTPDVGTVNASYSPEAIEAYGNGSDPWRYPDTDWFDDAFRDWAPRYRHHLEVDGGGEKVRVYSSLGYAFQDAIYNNSATNYKQTNFRINMDAQVHDYLKIDGGFSYRLEERNRPTEDVGAIFRMLMRGRPVEPEVWPNGMPGPDIENGQNPYVITTNATGYNYQPSNFLQFNGSAEISNPWVKGLKFKLMGARDLRFEREKVWQTPWELYYADFTTQNPDGSYPLTSAVRSNFTDARLTESYAQIINTNLTGLLTYDKTIGLHTFNLLLGGTKEKFKGEFFGAFRRNYISTVVDQLLAGGKDQQDTDGNAYNRARLGYYGRAQYNYKEKYLAEFIWRYDGSYIFPQSDRFGFFPGFLFGWNITNEDFFKVDFIDFLKIRASYGQMGNDQILFDLDADGIIEEDELVEYAFLSTYVFGQYPINGKVQTTLAESFLANPSFTWEVANNYNVGFDATLLNGSIGVVFEYFYNKRNQILIQETGSTPSSSGISSLLPPKNAGEVMNKGFDFNLSYYGKAGRLEYDVNFGGGYAKNEVVFMDEVPGAPDYQRQEGKPINAFLAYISDGAFRDLEEISANTIDYSQVTGQLLPGDMKIKDYNNDGIINGDDQVRLKDNNTPRWNYGGSIDFRFKNFDLSVLVQGAAGAQNYYYTESGDIGNFTKYDYDHRWTIDKPSSDHPRLASRGDTYYTGGAYGLNTHWLHSKNYVRVKNVEFGYNFPNVVLGKLNMSALRLYFNGSNLVTFTPNEVFDPEATAQNGVYYPLNKVINFGARLTF